METRRPLIVSFVLLLAVIMVTAWAWPRIPDSALIPIHWGIRGEPNGYAHKFVALMGAPAMMLVLMIIFWVVPRIEPWHDNLVASASAYLTGWIGTLALLAAVHISVILAIMGIIDESVFPRSYIAGMSILFLLLGNVLSKTKPNHFVGVRTPWSKQSAYSWEKTHRVTGWLYVSISLIALMMCIVGSTQFAFTFLIAGLVISGLIGVGLSYHFWRTDPER